MNRQRCARSRLYCLSASGAKRVEGAMARLESALAYAIEDLCVDDPGSLQYTAEDDNARPAER